MNNGANKPWFNVPNFDLEAWRLMYLDMGKHSCRATLQPRPLTGLEEAIISEELLTLLHNISIEKNAVIPVNVLLTAHLLADEQFRPNLCETQVKPQLQAHYDIWKPSHVKWRLAVPKVRQRRSLSQFGQISIVQAILWYLAMKSSHSNSVFSREVLKAAYQSACSQEELGQGFSQDSHLFIN
ncbi:hypothetical protein [Shewanella algae]|uniref:hypothetical protein n=1 Tax=Shewanella algae TaxID=38313 RepID=UPI0031F5BBFD